MNRSRLTNVWRAPAIEETEWHGPDGHNVRAWHVERYIWRTEDIPLYRVVIGEALNTPLSDVARNKWATLSTRTLEYVPTGRIMYDNTRAPAEATLFEYRLKDARDTRYNEKDGPK